MGPEHVPLPELPHGIGHLGGPPVQSAQHVLQAVSTQAGPELSSHSSAGAPPLFGSVNADLCA